MFKYLHNNKGVALLTVMVIMTVLVTIGSLILYISSAESRMVYDYGNNARAFYVAEAGADLAIQEWKGYINGLPVSNIGQLDNVDVSIFKGQLEAKLIDLINNISSGYNDGKNITIDYQWTPDQDILNHSSVPTPQTPNVLKIEIKGTYDDAVYKYEVKLWYYLNKTMNSYKGLGAYVVDTTQDTTPPTVSSTDPASSATDVPVDKTITVTFSESIQEGVNFNNIVIKDASNNTVNVNLSINGASLHIDPQGDLVENQTYTVTVPLSAVKDYATTGNPFLSNGYSFSFTTGEDSGSPLPPSPPDFTFNNNDWSGQGKWSISQDKIIHLSENKQTLFYNQSVFANFDFMVDLVYSEGNGQNKNYIGGIVMGPSLSESEATWYYMDKGSDNKIKLYVKTPYDDNPQLLSSTQVQFAYNTPYTLEAITGTNQIIFKFEGSEVGSVNWNTLLPSYLGLKDSAKGVEIEYRFP